MGRFIESERGGWYVSAGTAGSRACLTVMELRLENMRSRREW